MSHNLFSYPSPTVVWRFFGKSSIFFNAFSFGRAQRPNTIFFFFFLNGFGRNARFGYLLWAFDRISFFLSPVYDGSKSSCSFKSFTVPAANATEHLFSYRLNRITVYDRFGRYSNAIIYNDMGRV